MVDGIHHEGLEFARLESVASLEPRSPGAAIEENLRKDREGTLAKVGKDDLPLLYWTGAAWGAGSRMTSGIWKLSSK